MANFRAMFAIAAGTYCRRPTANDFYLLGDGHLLRGNQHIGLGTEDKLRIAELSHLRKIETGNFSRSRDALTEEDVEDPVEHEAEGEDEAHQRGNAHQLRHQLACVTVEEASDRAR